MCENLYKIALCALILQKWRSKSKCRCFFCFPSRGTGTIQEDNKMWNSPHAEFS